MKATKIVQKRKNPSIVITSFSKSVTIKIILPFCGRIRKMVFTVNTFITLLGTTLSQTPYFSYSQGSNFGYALEVESRVCFLTA